MLQHPLTCVRRSLFHTFLAKCQLKVKTFKTMCFGEQRFYKHQIKAFVYHLQQLLLALAHVKIQSDLLFSLIGFNLLSSEYLVFRLVGRSPNMCFQMLFNPLKQCCNASKFTLYTCYTPARLSSIHQSCRLTNIVCGSLCIIYFFLFGLTSIPYVTQLSFPSIVYRLRALCPISHTVAAIQLHVLQTQLYRKRKY